MAKKAVDDARAALSALTAPGVVTDHDISVVRGQEITQARFALYKEKKQVYPTEYPPPPAGDGRDVFKAADEGGEGKATRKEIAKYLMRNQTLRHRLREGWAKFNSNFGTEDCAENHEELSEAQFVALWQEAAALRESAGKGGAAAKHADPAAKKGAAKGDDDGDDDGDDGDAGGGMSKSAKKRAQKKRAAARKAAGEDEGGEGGDAAPAPQAEGGGKKKGKKKGGLMAQNKDFTIPVSKQYASGDYPTGQIVDYWQDNNTFRKGSAEKMESERIQNLVYDELRRGAEVHRQARKFVQQQLKPGMLFIDITNMLEAKVRELIEADGLNAGNAFPTGCSVNHCAAHWTPNSGDKTVLQYDDVVKFDFGTHINGRIIDCAWTHNFNPEFDPLKEAVRASTEEGIKHAGPDARLGEIGGRIKEVMESHEVEIKKKIYKVKAIENLSGHSIDPYRIHGGKSVPLVPDHLPDKMVEGEVYAIETFGSTGRGRVDEEGECSHYMKNYQSDEKPVIRHPKANQLYGYINKAHSSLAFCRKWLDQNGQTKHLVALKHLVEAGAITEYPPLCDVPGCYTAQFEHTILLRPTCKEVLSRGDDY